MSKIGLHFVENRNPAGNDLFIIKKLYSFIPPFDTYHKAKGKLVKRTVKTFIELEIYACQICVISFYHRGIGRGRNKYRIRCHLGAGHIKAIVRACLEAYHDFIAKEGPHAFVFSAADDIGEHMELNKRYAMYTRYINDNFLNRHLYEQDGSVFLNTFILISKDHPHKDECNRFYEDFNQRVEEEIDSANKGSK